MTEMSDSIITSYFEESKAALKKEFDIVMQQTKETLSECKRKTLSKV